MTIKFKSFYKLVEMSQESSQVVKILVNQNAKILLKNVAGWVLFLFFCCLIDEVVSIASAQGELKSLGDVFSSIKTTKPEFIDNVVLIRRFFLANGDSHRLQAFFWEISHLRTVAYFANFVFNFNESQFTIKFSNKPAY